jgi:hypothetical protein
VTPVTGPISVQSTRQARWQPVAAVTIALVLAGCSDPGPSPSGDSAATDASPTAAAPSQPVRLLDAQPGLRILKEVAPTTGSKDIGVVRFPAAGAYFVDLSCRGGTVRVTYGSEGFTHPCGDLPMRNHLMQDHAPKLTFRVTVEPETAQWALRVQQ